MRNFNQSIFYILLLFLASGLFTEAVAQKAELLKNYKWRAIGPGYKK
jgi:hypothetical protein